MSVTKIQNYSIAFQAQTMIAFLEHLNIKECRLLGLSYGGFVALEMARLDPGRFSKLIIVNSPGTAIPKKNYEGILRTQKAENFNELVIPRNPAALDRLCKAIFYRPPPLPPFLYHDFNNAELAPRARHLTSLLDYIIENADVIGRRSYRLPMDTLLLWGRHDKLFPLELAYILKTRIGEKCRLSIIEQAAHVPNIEQPVVFNHQVMRFLDKSRFSP